ncbi:hypothetical protein LCGC14_1189630 [marine sediment metagenome]|uniref:Uncharacterized protein n=1 Tax=marine sediment metagenome TaxID=412755 RepID=A0A0F9PQ69_9ZZZZ
MAKKTWIKVKRGILAPKHRETLGKRLWLYLYLLDKADWEAGMIYGWKDKDEADDINMPWRTLQGQRQQLEKDDYITCHIRQYNIDIEIHNWTNPREYSGKLYNKKNRGYVKSRTPKTGQVASKQRTTTFNSQTTSEKPQITKVVVNRSSIKRALFEAGIHGEKIQQQLSSLPHMTAEYIKAHAYKAEREGTDKGLLIHKMKSGDPMPENGGHQEGCGCDECRQKYVTGKYAEHVEH